jgi:hypothetical protein
MAPRIVLPHATPFAMQPIQAAVDRMLTLAEGRAA